MRALGLSGSLGFEWEPWVFVLPPVFLKIFHRLGENRRKSPTCLVTCYGRTEVAQNRLKIDFLTEKKSIFPKFFFFSGGRRPVDRNPKTTTPLRPTSRRSVVTRYQSLVTTSIVKFIVVVYRMVTTTIAKFSLMMNDE